MYNLVIVESPPKANTIKAYLGSNYKVIACKGHIRDLPKSTLGIDVDNGFRPHYINIRGKGDVIKELKKEAKGASKILLATDPDREGEAIAWHIAEQLGMELVIQDMEFEAVVTSVGKNGVDVAMAGLTVNETRKKSVNFTDSYYNAAQMLVVMEDEDAFDACKTAEDVLAALAK